MKSIHNRKFFKPYIWIVISSSLLLIAMNFDQIMGNLSVNLAIFVLLSITVQTIEIPLVRGFGTASYGLIVSIMLLFGPGTAALVNFLTTVITPVILRKKRSFLPDAFSGAQFALCIFAAYGLYLVLGGSPVHKGISVGNQDVVLIIPITILFFLVNHLFIDLFYIFRGDPLTFKDYIALAQTDSLVYAISAPFAVLIVLLSQHVFLLFLIILPLALVAQMFKMYQRLKRLNQVHQFVSRIQQEFNVDQIYSTVANATQTILKCPGVILWIKGEDGNSLHPKVILPDALKEFVPKFLSTSQGIVGAAVTGGRTEISNDAWKDTRVVAINASLHFETLLAVPLLIRGKTIGAIACYGIQKRGFTADDQETVELIAAQSAVYIDNAKIYADLEEMSLRDANTGLYNARYFYKELTKQISQSRVLRSPLSIVVLDADHFKAINDTFGHLAGDMVLKQVGRVLEEAVKDYGIATRYGGEEFVLLLNCTTEQAYQLTEKIRLQIAELSVTYNDTTIENITISAGIASYPEHALLEKDLLEKADQAMYSGAKACGRNKVAIYSPEISSQAKPSS